MSNVLWCYPCITGVFVFLEGQVEGWRRKQNGGRALKGGSRQTEEGEGGRKCEGNREVMK